MRRISVLALSFAAILLVASCSESDDFDEVGADESTQDADQERPDSEDEPSGDDFDEAVAALEAQGLSTELSECAIESLVDQGIDVSTLDAAIPEEETLDALALAGSECAEFIDGLPEGVFDFDDPAVRNGFITSFSATTGLSEEVAECVLDDLLAKGVDVEAIIEGTSGGVPDDEITTAVQDSVTTCA